MPISRRESKRETHNKKHDFVTGDKKLADALVQLGEKLVRQEKGSYYFDPRPSGLSVNRAIDMSIAEGKAAEATKQDAEDLAFPLTPKGKP